MSLTQQIGQLITTATDLTDRVDNWLDDANARLDAALRQAAELYRLYYIDAAAGDDADVGDRDHPLASLAEALRRAPRGGILTVYVCSDITVTDRMYAPGGAVRIYGWDRGSDTVTRRTIHWSGQIDSAEDAIAGISMRGGDYLYFENVRHVVPKAQGTLVEWHRGVIDAYHSSVVALEDCEIDAETSADCYLLRAHASSRLVAPIAGTTITSAAAGRTFYGVAAGDDPNSWWRYRTNLTQN